MSLSVPVKNVNYDAWLHLPRVIGQLIGGAASLVSASHRTLPDTARTVVRSGGSTTKRPPRSFQLHGIKRRFAFDREPLPLGEFFPVGAAANAGAVSRSTYATEWIDNVVVNRLIVNVEQSRA